MNVEMNIIKALAIIAMVVGHSRGPWVANVYLYHMALFIFVSGYFYNEKYSENPKELIIKRFKSLYIPFLKFNFFILIFKILILENIFLDKGNGVIKDFFLGIKSLIFFNHVDPLISAFWFLKSLFIVNIIFCIISYLIKRHSRKKLELKRFMIILNLFFIFYIITKNGYLKGGEISFISRAFIINIFFYMGFLYHKYENRLKVFFKPIFLLISFIYIIKAARYDSIDLYSFYFSNVVFLIISSIIGIYLNIYLAKLIIKYIKKVSIIEYVGKKSLWILCYHMIAFKLAILIKIKFYNLDYSVLGSFPTYIYGKNDWILDTIVGIIIPILLCYLFEKLKKGRLLYGKIQYINK